MRLNNRITLVSLMLALCSGLVTTSVSSQPTTGPVSTGEESGTYLYRVSLVQATPGKFREFIAFTKQKFDHMEADGAKRPFWMRHSQGDRWDFMILYPMGSQRSYYDATDPESAPENGFVRMTPGESNLTAWQEDIYVRGPAWDVLEPILRDSGFFHIEMFKALPGRRDELLRQRRMENEFLRLLGRPANFIFERDSGGDVDAFTLGYYRDIKHFAESADIPTELEESAARKAGFEGVAGISPYLRSLISEHHDTLAVAIN
jgi:hypothetical protein